MASCQVVCPQNITLSVSLLERYSLPSSKTPIPPPIYNAISTLCIGILVLFSMAFASWIMDWEPCETTVDQKIRIAFPDHRKRREYMLNKVAEMDAIEKTKREIEAKKDLMRKIAWDAVQLEREYEALAFEFDERGQDRFESAGHP